jgi:hypothetical protein
MFSSRTPADGKMKFMMIIEMAGCLVLRMMAGRNHGYQKAYIRGKLSVKIT